MNKKIIVEMNLDDFEFGYTPSDNENEYYEVPSDKSAIDASKDLKCSPELLETIINNFDYLQDLLRKDLLDLYELANKNK